MTTQNHKSGHFITLEGSEGAGKSTSLAFIERWLKEQSIEHIVSREPGGTPFAEQIRDLLLENRDEKVAPLSELLLMYAARVQHVEAGSQAPTREMVCQPSGEHTEET